MSHQIIQPDGWKQPKGYANGVLAEGRTLWIGGQVGWDENEQMAPGGFVGQMEQALKNIVTILEAAGGKPEHLVRMTWYVTDKQEYLARQRDIGEVYPRVVGRHFPAMSLLVISGLVEDSAVLEIEATAVLPG